MELAGRQQGQTVRSGGRRTATRTETSGGAETQDTSIQGREVRSPRTGWSRGMDPVPRTGTAGNGGTGRQQGHPDWNIRRRWRGEGKKDADSEMERERDDGAAPQVTIGKARRQRNDVGPVPRTGTSGAGQEQAAKLQSRAPRTGACGEPQRKEDKHQEPGQDYPGKREQVYRNIRKEEERRGGAQGARTRTSGEHKPWTGKSREGMSTPVMARSGNDRATGESGQARGQPGRSRARARWGTAAVEKEMRTKTG